MTIADEAQNAPVTDVAVVAMHRMVKAWETGDTSAFDEYFDKDVVYHMAPFPDMGREELKGFVGAFRAGFPDFSIDIDEDIISGSTSVHRWHCTGTFSGAAPILPVPPTGQRATATGNLLFHWSDDRIVEAWHVGDWLGWLTTAGVLPPLASA